MVSQISKHTGRTIIIDGEQYKNFTGTAYLNLPYKKEFRSFFKKGIKKFGVSYGSSPLSKPQFSVFRNLEKLLAHFYQTEEAVLFQTGFAATQTVINLFLQEGYSFQYSDFSHPALSVSHSLTEKRAFASDLLDPIRLSILKEEDVVKKTSVIDASHGFGIADELIQKIAANKDVVICGSLNKALGINGGVVLCSSSLREKLMRMPAYSTSSTPGPAACYALFKAFKSGLIARQQEYLSYLLTQVPSSQAYRFQPPIPVLTLTQATKTVFNQFLNHRMMIWHNEYPKNSGELTNRVVIHAGLKEEDLNAMLNLIL